MMTTLLSNQAGAAFAEIALTLAPTGAPMVVASIEFSHAIQSEIGTGEMAGQGAS